MGGYDERFPVSVPWLPDSERPKVFDDAVVCAPQVGCAVPEAAQLGAYDAQQVFAVGDGPILTRHPVDEHDVLRGGLQDAAAGRSLHGQSPGVQSGHVKHI